MANDSYHVLMAQANIPRKPFRGFLGDLAFALCEGTEASPTTVLIRLLQTVSIISGRRFSLPLAGGSIIPNLYCFDVGPTSERKGFSDDTGFYPIKNHLSSVFDQVVYTAVGSGEAFVDLFADHELIERVGSPPERVERPPEKKCLIVDDAEGAVWLEIMIRRGNTLSGYVRKAFDGGRLATRTRSSSVTATNYLTNLVLQITPSELRKKLSGTDIANGFANRYFCNRVQRLQLFSNGGTMDHESIRKLTGRFDQLRVQFESMPKEMSFSPDATKYWDRFYIHFNEQKKLRGGVLGDLKARGDTISLRLAMLYALADASSVIEVPHLEAAIHLWEYSESSWDWVYQQSADYSEENLILDFLANSNARECTMTELHAAFGRNKPAPEINYLLEQLKQQKRISINKGKGKARIISLISNEPVETNSTNFTKFTDVEHGQNS